MNLTIASVVGACLLTAFVLIFSLRPAHAATPEQQVVAEFRARVALLYPDATITQVDGMHFRVEPIDAVPIDFFLDSAVAEYKSAPGNLTAIVESRLQPPPQEIAQGHLIPVIRSTGWLEHVEKQLQAAGLTADQRDTSLPISRQLATGLVIAYVNNQPDNFAYVTASELENLGISSVEGLHELALQNLSKMFNARKIVGKAGRYRIELDDVFESSFPLLGHAQIASAVGLKGDVVVALPSRNGLLVCGAEDSESVDSLREVAGRIHDAAAYPITTHLYRIASDGSWSLVEPT